MTIEAQAGNHYSLVYRATDHLRPISTHLADWTSSLHLQDNEEIVSSPPRPQTLPEHVNRDGEKREEQRRASENVHDLLWSMTLYPRVREVREAVEHEVLDEVRRINSTH